MNGRTSPLWQAIVAWIGFSLFTPATVAGTAGATLAMQLSAQRIELGKPLWLTFHSSQTRVSLRTLDLDALARDFAVLPDDAVRMLAGQRGQQWRVRLIPRLTGHLRIPPLLFAGTKTRPVTLEVSDPVDPRSHRPFKVVGHISTTTPWHRQPVLATISVVMQDDILILELPYASSRKANIIPLETRRRTLKVDGRALMEHTTGWAVLPVESGLQKIELPPVQLVRDGVVTHRFYLPELRLQVKALPVYVPGNIPVGRLTVDAPGPDRRVLVRQKFAPMHMTLQSVGVVPEALPALDLQLKSSADMQVYPGQHQLETSRDADGLRSRVRYAVPLKPVSQGVVSIPGVRIQFFDPQTGKLVTRETSGHKVLVLGTLTIALVGLSMFVVLTWLANRVVRQSLRRWRSFVGYRDIVRRLQTGRSLTQFRQALTQVAEAEAWPANQSLLRLQQHLREVAIPLPDSAVDMLMRGLYRADACDLDVLRLALIETCFRRWPPLRWLPGTVNGRAQR